MYKIKLLTTWIEKNGAKQPDAVRLLQPTDSLMDICGEAVPVNTPVVTPVIVEVWGSEATLAAIEADTAHGTDAILSVEVVNDTGIPE